MFYTHNIFDYEDLDKPVKTHLIVKKIDSGLKIDFDLTLHNLALTDDIYSPFKSSKEISYITLTDNQELVDSEKSYFQFYLSNNIVKEKRTRYSIWDLLGDVGGFNDGLILVCQLLTAAYSAASFKTKFLAAIFFDSNRDAQRQSSRENRSTIATLLEPSSTRLDPAAP